MYAKGKKEMLAFSFHVFSDPVGDRVWGEQGRNW